MRPFTAVYYFEKSYRKDVKDRYPRLSYKETKLIVKGLWDMAPVGVKKRYEDERSELFIAYKVLIVEYNNAIEGSMNQHKKSNNKVDNKGETAPEKMVASQLKKITLLGCFSPIKLEFKGTGALLEALIA